MISNTFCTLCVIAYSARKKSVKLRVSENVIRLRKRYVENTYLNSF